MLNCVPVVVKGEGGGDGGVLESRPPGKLRPRNRGVLSLVSFFFPFLFFSSSNERGEERARISEYGWPMLYADERKRRIRNFRNDGHPSFVLLPLSTVTHPRQIFIPKWRRGGGNIFTIDRSIERRVVSLFLKVERLGLV